MKKILVVFCFLFLVGSVSVAQNTYKVSGKVVDDASGFAFSGAVVKVVETGKVVFTDHTGFFSIQLTSGQHTLEVSFIGFEISRIPVNVNGSAVVLSDVRLIMQTTELDVIVIQHKEPDENVTQVEMSTVEMDIEEIKKIPAFMGEVDVVKAVQMLPGVTTVGEGATGFNVRGGNIDQNLILFDKAPIYSSSHLFGFFSVFNTDVIDHVKLYKGGIPARFGGRVSSILDIHSRNGNADSLRIKGGIGLVSSRLTVEGPLQKGKSSFLVSGRRSYADLFLKLSPNESVNQVVAYFYDLNGKLNFQLDDKNELSISAYYGRDVFRFGKLFSFTWGNFTSSAIWNHTFSDDLNLEVSGVYTNYSYGLGSPNIFEWVSQIGNTQLNADLNYQFDSKNKFKGGIQGLLHTINPTDIKTFGEQPLNSQALNKEMAYENAVYLEHEYIPNNKFTVLYGLRYSHFTNIGRGDEYVYATETPINRNDIIDTVNAKGNVLANYGGFEPRLGVKYAVDSVSSVKIGYNRTRQYIHLVSNTTSGLPIDVWKLTDQFMKPVISDQIALGYFRNLKNNMYETSAEVYYKTMQNVLDYKNGASLLFNETLETELIAGKGRAYGLELFVKKRKGDLTGFISYTISRSERKTVGETLDRTVNGGEWYAANINKLHDLKMVASYQFTKRLSVGANFVYASGRAVTYPDGKYEYQGFTIPKYVSRNQDKLPAYHRLDLSMTIDSKKNENRKWQSSWVFSLYNVYARRNAYSITFMQDQDDPNRTSISRLSILGTVVPAATYNFEF